MYIKITNKTENHNGLQYHDGLNIDPVPFAKEGSCCPGGIYFTKPEYFGGYVRWGDRFIREAIIPEDADMVQDPELLTAWRASKVILGPRFDLHELDTWRYLYLNGFCCYEIKHVLMMIIDFKWITDNDMSADKRLDIIRYLTWIWEMHLGKVGE